MRFSAPSSLIVSALLLLASRLPAQQTPSVVGSTISGHIFCADTNTPARFAKVQLKATGPTQALEDMMKTMSDSMARANDRAGTPGKAQTDDQKKFLADWRQRGNQVTDEFNSSTVGLDGSYSFAGVQPGTYYVHATFTGYIDPFSQFSDADFTSTDPAVRGRVAQLFTVTVTGTNSARADLRLERGAAVSGRIVYDDGSPAAGWTLTVIKPRSIDGPSVATAAATGTADAKTDDRGRFRIAGLATGVYALRASLIASGTGISASNLDGAAPGINLAVYSGDTFKRADAKTMKLATGDELTGVDISIPSHRLHNITGHLISKEDGHTLNVGQVSLTVPNNPAIYLTSAVRVDGSFNFEGLPNNITYSLTAIYAADGSDDGRPDNRRGMSLLNYETLHKYGTDSASVLLADTDVDSVTLSVAQTDWKPPAK